MHDSPLRVLMLGFGQVGRQLAKLLIDGTAAKSIRIVGIVNRSGAWTSGRGLDLAACLDRAARGCLDSESEGFRPWTPRDAMASIDFDVLAELTTLSIRDRGEPAVSHVRWALQAGKHVATANKGPAAFAHAELTELSRRRGGRFLHESAVMDAVPLFSLLRECLPACRVTSFEGVVNSTVNFVLNQAIEGADLEASLARAKEAGFAEEDASLDLDGWDAAAKCAVLCNSWMQGVLTPLDVRRQTLSPEHLERAKGCAERGKRLRQVTRGRQTDGGPVGSVAFEEVDGDSPLHGLRGTSNVLRIETDKMAPLTLIQEEPSTVDTALGVLHDILRIRGSA